METFENKHLWTSMQITLRISQLSAKSVLVYATFFEEIVSVFRNIVARAKKLQRITFFFFF